MGHRLGQKDSDSVSERFFRLVKKTEGCWHWQGTTNRRYGRIQVYGRRVAAHRISYEIHYGPIRKGLFVCHRCDNPMCVNPAHLFLGTHSDNVQDCVNKGRSARGVKHGCAKLTEKCVKTMRALHSSGKFTQASLAKKYKINRPYATRIINRNAWKHVQD